MARLPVSGADSGVWGDILNDYLLQAHKDTGALKDDTVGTSTIQNGAVTAAKVTSGANGVATLDNGGQLPAAQARQYNFRGHALPGTTYNRWDVISYYGRRILATTTFTTTSATKVFISSANYVSLGPVNQFFAYDYGYRADGAASSAAGNTAALKAAILDASYSVYGGGEVVVPAGFGFVNKDGANPWAIELLPFVTLVGQGMRATEISLNDGQNCTLVKAHTSTGSGNTNACYTGLRNLRLSGRKAGQTGGAWHGIDFTTSPQYTAQTGDLSFDMHHYVDNVQVYSCKGNGVQMFGRSATVLHNVHAWSNDGHGFNGTFDTKMSDCQAEGNGLAGFYRISEATNCKSFGNGKVDPAAGHGFYFNFPGAATSCFAQNNSAYGVLFDNVKSASYVAGVVDTNNYNSIGGVDGGGEYPGIGFINGASKCVVEANCTQGDQSGAGFIGAQLSALYVQAGCEDNFITVTHDVSGSLAGSAGPIIKAGSDTSGNLIIGNGDFLAGGAPAGVLEDITNVTISSPSDGQVLTYDSGVWVNAGAGGGGTSYIHGDGTAGSFTLDGLTNPSSTYFSFSGGNYTILPNIHSFASLTINSGVTLFTAGVPLQARGTITNNGTISNAGGDAAGATAGVIPGKAMYGGQAGRGGATGAGAAGLNTNGTSAGAGGAGGSGGSGAGGTGGTVQTASADWLYKNPQAVLSGVISYFGTNYAVAGGGSGGSGSGDGVNSGGGGGGSGGVLAILANAVVNNGVITAKGGNGGAGTGGNSGGGGGGGGGLIAIYSTSAMSGSGSTVVTGGTAGAGVGTGVAGTAGGVGRVVQIVI